MGPPKTNTGQDLHNQPDASDIREALQRVLNSAAFRGSKRCHEFLEFVVGRSLGGDGDSLKERTLATEVFGRKATADLGDDSIVRVGAREVRKRLAQYYMSSGADDPLRIDLPPGSYVPVFRRHSEPADAAPLSTAIVDDVPPQPAPHDSPATALDSLDGDHRSCDRGDRAHCTVARLPREYGRI